MHTFIIKVTASLRERIDPNHSLLMYVVSKYIKWYNSSLSLKLDTKSSGILPTDQTVFPGQVIPPETQVSGLKDL